MSHFTSVSSVAPQVQTDHSISIDNLQVEMKELNERLEAMEKQGVELERSLRDCIENGSPNSSYRPSNSSC